MAHNKHDVSQKELRKAADMLRKRYGGNCPGSDVRGGLKVALEYIWMVLVVNLGHHTRGIKLHGLTSPVENEKHEIVAVPRLLHRGTTSRQCSGWLSVCSSVG